MDRIHLSAEWGTAQRLHARLVDTVRFLALQASHPALDHACEDRGLAFVLASLEEKGAVCFAPADSSTLDARDPETEALRKCRATPPRRGYRRGSC